MALPVVALPVVALPVVALPVVALQASSGAVLLAEEAAEAVPSSELSALPLLPWLPPPFPLDASPSGNRIAQQ